MRKTSSYDGIWETGYEDNMLARVGQHPNLQGNLKIFLASNLYQGWASDGRKSSKSGVGRAGNVLGSRTPSIRRKGIINNNTNSKYLLNMYYWLGRVLSALPTLSQLKLGNSPKK